EPRLYPVDPFARARVRALVETINAGTQPLQNLAVMRKVSSDAEARKEWSRFFVVKGLTTFERLMERNEADGVRGPFAHGAALTAADAVLVPQVYNARRFDVDLSAFPRVTRANEAALALPEVQAAAPEAQPDRPAAS